MYWIIKIIHSRCFARRVLCLKDVIVEVDVANLKVPIAVPTPVLKSFSSIAILFNETSGLAKNISIGSKKIKHLVTGYIKTIN